MNKKIITFLVAGLGLVATAPLAHANAELWINGTEEESSTASSGSIVYGTGNNAVLMTWSTTGGIYLDVGASVNKQETIKVSDNYNPAPGGGVSVVEIGYDIKGNLNGTLAAYWDAGNVLGDETTQLGKTLNLAPGASTDGAINASGPYSLTEVVKINSGSGTVSTDGSVAVPDGGNVAILLGSAMIGLTCLRARFSRKA